jgi:hypothetical protein
MVVFDDINNEIFASFFGSFLAALTAFLIFILDKIHQNNKDKSLIRKIHENSRYFNLIAAKALKENVEKQLNDLKVIIDNFSTNLDKRKMSYLPSINFHVKRVRQINEQELLKAFLEEMNDRNKQNSVTDLIFQFFTKVDFFENIDKSYNALLEQFSKQYENSWKGLLNDGDEFQFLVRKKRNEADNGEKIFSFLKQTSVIVPIFNPLIIILDKFNISKPTDSPIENIYQTLILPSRQHLNILNINNETLIDDFYRILNRMEGSYKNCMRLRELFLKELIKLNNESQESLNDFTITLKKLYPGKELD